MAMQIDTAPVTATLRAAVVAFNGATIPAGSDIKYAFAGPVAAVRVVSTGAGVKVDADTLRAALSAPAVATAVSLDDLVGAFDAAPAEQVTAATTARPGHGDKPAHTRPMTELDYHGTDSFVREGAILAARTVADACKVAGLGWTVAPQAFTTESGAKSADHRAIVRSDTNTVLSVMGKDYTPLSPVDTFQSLQPMVDQGARFCGGGSFREGRTVWMQVDLGTYNIGSGGKADNVNMFAHIRDTYDGSKAWSIQIGSTRVVCANTLMHACDSGKLLARFKHNKQIRANVKAVEETLAALRCEAAEIGETYRTLNAWKMTAADRAGLLEELMGEAPDAKVEGERAVKSWRETSDELSALLNGRGVIGLADSGLDVATGWAALNAVTQYTTHNVATNRAKGDVLVQTRRVYESDKVAAIADTAWAYLAANCPALAAAVA